MKRDMCKRCLEQLDDTDLALGREPTTARSEVEFEGHSIPSTLNTAPSEAIPDSALRRAKLVQGMLPD